MQGGFYVGRSSGYYGSMVADQPFAAPPPPAPVNPTPDVTGIPEANLYAALSYVGVLLLVPLLVRKDDPFVQFHLKQGIVLLGGLILGLFAVLWIAAVGNIVVLLLLIVDIVGLVQALLGRRWRIPLVGMVTDRFTL